MQYFVYIMASKPHGVIYIGVTNNLERRVYQHKQGEISGFTKTYFVKRLVHFEITTGIKSAIEREKQLKAWKRQWKINLIEAVNPKWQDLSSTF